MKNNVIKLLTDNKEVRLFLVDSTTVLQASTVSEMKTSFAKELYTKIFTCCCLLRGFLSSDDQRLSIKVRFSKEYYIYCEIDGFGNVNCTFSSELKSYIGPFQDLVDEDSILSITRGSWSGGMFSGTVGLDSVSIESCLTHFYSQSEQLQTIFKTWIQDEVVRGCVVQPLPFANRTTIRSAMEVISQNENELCKVIWADLPNRIFPFATVIEAYGIQTECNCSGEIFKGILMSLDVVELKQSIQTNKSEELECGICGAKYQFDINVLKEIVKIKEDGYNESSS